MLSMVTCVWAFTFFLNGKLFIAFLLVASSIGIQLMLWMQFIKKMRDTEKLILAIQRKDFSLFPKNIERDSLKSRAAQLYYQAKDEHKNLYSYKNLYDSILDSMEIGFLILSKSVSDKDWQVYYCNPTFTHLLKVPKYNSWAFYKDKVPDFFQLVEQTEFQDSQEFIDISIEERSPQSFSIRTSRISNYETDFCVISMESIQKIVDRKEKQAWNNLMKVISHELLNTLTPVNSLVHNLEYLTDQQELTHEDQKEIKDSLKIINSKSQQLVHFIDSYRQIAELPKPKKTRLNLRMVLENVLKIFESEFKTQNIDLIYTAQDYFVLADGSMMERVFVNLLTNAQLAVQNQQEKCIKVIMFESNNRIVVSIEDNGQGIDPQIESKIFLPFFTTRAHGSGIGLTLAKSIMEAHNGYLIYRKLQQGSAFEVWFT